MDHIAVCVFHRGLSTQEENHCTRRYGPWLLVLGWQLSWVSCIVHFAGNFNDRVDFCLIQWVVACRGPTYPAVFNPLLLVFVAILESLFMKEELFVGSILGMILIIGGLYA
ncbi:hypothetical protein MRB53_003313 [Persea americana]|uniref:Uncharacterized protein n=1 Tax=Persea americana TaxID=3435 RepID=A0ACC2MX29_PERAE|nr:hypothetical protein MRB53_003313 [Persea americana]